MVPKVILLGIANMARQAWFAVSLNFVQFSLEEARPIMGFLLSQNNCIVHVL